MPEEGAVERPDGRVVAWASWGVPSGRPLLLIHGTPGSRLDRSPDWGEVAEIVEDAYRTVASPKFLKLLDAR